MRCLASELGQIVKRHWRTTTVRWLYVYAAFFVLSLTLIVSSISWVATHSIAINTDSNLGWQLRYFDSIPDQQLPSVIFQRLEHERRHASYYGLFDANGRYIAGDIAQPPQMTYNEVGITLRHSLLLIGGAPSPVVRALGEIRPNGTRLIVARDMTSVMLIREICIRTLIVDACVAVLAVLIGTLVLGMRQVNRIWEMRRVTRSIAEGDLGQRLPVGRRHDEIDILADLVNHMLDEIERLMEEVKGACDGIAHDLRTPLARLRTQLDRIGERDAMRGDAEGRAMLESARGETDRLLDRFRAMLRISEISTLQRRGGFARVDLAALVTELAELYDPLAESRDLQWQVHIDQVEPVHGDRELMFEAFSNLIDNAIKFAPQGGRVGLALRKTLRGPLLEITDNGPGIQLEERGVVLRRFVRGEVARHLSGSGLGLSIVAAVLRLHDFTLHIEDAEPAVPSGARMRVECWPSALAGQQTD